MNSNIERAAEQAHEANRIYCRTLGDNSQRRWDDSPQWQKDSAVAGVEAVVGNFEITPEELHASWMAAKVVDGWVFGPIKDVVTKTHPCLVEYKELPLEQRVKDIVFSVVVKSSLIIGTRHGS